MLIHLFDLGRPQQFLAELVVLPQTVDTGKYLELQLENSHHPSCMLSLDLWRVTLDESKDYFRRLDCQLVRRILRAAKHDDVGTRFFLDHEEDRVRQHDFQRS